jgi:TatD DNase family protein
LKLDNQKIDSEIDFIRENKDKLVAIGEVGLDFKEDSEQHGRQIEILKKFIRLAIELKKPVIVHSRKAELECIEILEKENAKKAVMHCFSGKFSLVERIVKNNWSLTIPTSVKFSEHFQKIAEKVPIENLFCETDSPFLHPDKLRNNEPANVVVSYQKIAEIKKMPLEEVKKKIFENYERLFCSQVTQIALSNQKPKSQQRL